MIQPLQSPQSAWFLHWVDLHEPVPMGTDYFLPTLLVICDGAGVPVSSPLLLEELDQPRVENLLLRLFDTVGPPQRLSIAASEDWDEESWVVFSRDQRVDIHFHRPAESPAGDIQSLAVSVVQRVSEEGDAGLPTPGDIARSLVNAALRVRSSAKKEALLRAALERDPECASARIELADGEFQRGAWKACLKSYEQLAASEARRWKGQSVTWWLDRETRPCLRAIYGAAMTLWQTGRHSEAAERLETLLTLNPADNQGARFFIPMLRLLTEELDAAAQSFETYEALYPDDYPEPALLFGWGLSLSLQGDETTAKKKYREGILKNLFIAPMLLEESPPPRALWLPNDRAEPGYASEFFDSYAVLWDRDPGALRLLRELWHDMRAEVARLVSHRETMLDFQDQRYEPDFKQCWQKLLDEDERLANPRKPPEV